MFRRLLLLAVVLAVPVLTALGTQQLAGTTEPPVLPVTPVQPQTSPEPAESPESEGQPGSDHESISEQGTDTSVTGPGRDPEYSDTDLTAGQLSRSRPDDAEPVQDSAAESDMDGRQDDAPASGTTQR